MIDDFAIPIQAVEVSASGDFEFETANVIIIEQDYL